jgi:5-methyltetrahydropteroyltriglutamate--homocysteine methyltransferase
MTDLPRFPTSLVGSLPRPRWLIQVLRDRDQGNIPDIEWQALAEHAVRDAVQLQETVGLDIVGDGEQRRDGFLTFVQERLFGLRRMSLAERVRSEADPGRIQTRLMQLDVPTSGIKSPVASDTVRLLNPHKGIVLEEVDYLVGQTSRPVRVSVPGPYTLSRTLWSNAHSKRVYASADDLADKLVALLRDEIARLAERGVSDVQIDEPALAWLAQESHEPTFAGALIRGAGDLLTERALAFGIIANLCENITTPTLWLHISQGDWTRMDVLPQSLGIDFLVTFVSPLNVHGVSLPIDYEDESVLFTLGCMADSKHIALGVVAARSDSVESPESIVQVVQRVLTYVPVEQIHLTPDVGFAPFFERNLNTLETAQAKLESLVEAARRLREM